MRTYAVIPTHNRPDMLRATVESIAPQVNRVIVVDNASDPPVQTAGLPSNVAIAYDPQQPPNLGTIWNKQLDAIAGAERVMGAGAWNVCILCDDSPVPAGWVQIVSDGMRRFGASAASTHSYEPAEQPYVLRELSNGADRMCPWAFMLPGERGLRADDSMAWWYVDTDIDWRARLDTGTLVTPGPVVNNLLVGEYTNIRPELGEQAARDGETFNRKWAGQF